MVHDQNNSGRREQPARAVVLVLDQQVALLDHLTIEISIYIFVHVIR